MLIKVCGIVTDADRLAETSDMVGFIYYDRSPRHVDVAPISKQALRVGVFVDENMDVIERIISRDRLDYVQLHGNETPEQCTALARRSKVIKAFSIGSRSDLDKAKDYRCDLFLFDTKGAAKGGNGVQFDWSILDHYTGSTPFILSGGIGPDDAQAIKALDHPMLAGVDLNSRFESAPGQKDMDKIKLMIDELRN